jgi:hypothetical protein
VPIDCLTHLYPFDPANPVDCAVPARTANVDGIARLTSLASNDCLTLCILSIPPILDANPVRTSAARDEEVVQNATGPGRQATGPRERIVHARQKVGLDSALPSVPVELVVPYVRPPSRVRSARSRSAETSSDSTATTIPPRSTVDP